MIVLRFATIEAGTGGAVNRYLPEYLVVFHMLMISRYFTSAFGMGFEPMMVFRREVNSPVLSA